MIFFTRNSKISSNAHPPTSILNFLPPSKRSQYGIGFSLRYCNDPSLFLAGVYYRDVSLGKRILPILEFMPEHAVPDSGPAIGYGCSKMRRSVGRDDLSYFAGNWDFDPNIPDRLLVLGVGAVGPVFARLR